MSNRGGGKRTKRLYRGTCIVTDCERLVRANNYCNKHFCQEYFRTNYHRRSKRQLSQEIGHIAGFNRAKGIEVINAIVKAMTLALRKKESVKVAGFGTFETYVYQGRTHVSFRPYKELRYMINNPDWRP